MTTEIYIQTTNVFLGKQHLGIWIVQDGETTIIDARASGTEGAGIDSSELGEIVLEKNFVPSAPGQSEIEQFNLNQLTFSSAAEAESAASKIIDYYDSMGTSFMHGGREFVRTGVDYSILGPNSNSVGQTLINLMEQNFYDLNIYEDGDSNLKQYTENDYFGIKAFVDTDSSNLYTAYSQEKYAFFDVGGDETAVNSDKIIIEQDAFVHIFDSNNANSFNTIVFRDYTSAQIKYGQSGDDLTIYDSTGKALANVEDYFDDSKTPNTTKIEFQDSAGAILSTQDLGSLTASDLTINNMFNMPNWYTSLQVLFGVEIGGFWDPLVINLDGDASGADITADQTVYFDIDGDGIGEAISWVTGDDGFLVRDLNGNGTIDDITEMFGNDQVDGFTALSALDADSNGVVEGTELAGLQLWQDINQDGISQAGELSDLSAHDILSIDVSNVMATGQIEGVTHTGSGTTSTGTIDVYNTNFAVNQFNTRYTAEYDFDVRAAFLPTVRGYADLPDFHVALSLDNDETDPNSLMSLMTSIAGYSMTEMFENWDSVISTIEQAMFRWAGVDGIDPASRGQYVDDARQLEFIESYFGEAFVDRNEWGTNPGEVQANAIRDLWEEDLFSRLASNVLVQMSTGQLFNDVNFQFESDAFSFSTNSLTAIDELEAAATALPDTAARHDFWVGVAHFFNLAKQSADGYQIDGSDLTYLDAAIQASDATLSWASISYDYENPEGDTIVGTAGVDDANVDALYGGTIEADTLSGLDGADVLHGGQGNDILYGHSEDGTGDDGAADELRGEDGDDVLHGGSGDDKLYGGAGNDHLIGGAGNDELHAGTDGSQDLMEGGAGDDTYFISNSTVFNGENYILDTSGTDTIELGGVGLNLLTDANFVRQGNDGLKIQVFETGIHKEVIIGHQLADTNFTEAVEVLKYSTSSGNHTLNLIDYLNNFSGTMETQGTANDDVINGILIGNQQDLIYGDDGNDTLSGDAGDDQLYGENGNDTIFGGEGADTIDGGNGADTLYGGLGNDIITDSGFSSGSLYGDEGDDTITGGEYAYGGEGNDTITAYNAYGGAGNDIVTGIRVLDGGAGDDQLIAGTIGGFTSETTYIASSGNDTISDRGPATDPQIDKIVFGAGVTLQDLSFERVGVDYRDLKITHPTGTITILDQYDITTGNPSVFHAVEQIEFDDGSTVNIADLTITTNLTNQDDTIDYDYEAGDSIDVIYGFDGNDTLTTGHEDDTIYAGAGDDIVYAQSGNDIIDGGAGYDVLYGGSGADTYIYGAGGDFIREDNSTGDKILFNSVSDINAIDMWHDGLGNLLISDGTNSPFIIDDQFTNSSKVVELVELSNGSQHSISGGSLVFETRGTSGDDTLSGIIDTSLASENDTIYGLEGNDNINGYRGNDILNGGEGNDYLEGGRGNDILDGGDGDDTLHGGDSSSSYHGIDTFITSAGNDTIVSYSTSGSNQKRLRFTDGDTNSDLTFERTGVNDLTVHHGTGTILIEDQFISAGGVDYFQYNDGGNITSVHYTAMTAALLLNGTAGNDIMNGVGAGLWGAQDDIFNGGSGDDTINAGSGNDVAIYTGNYADFTLTNQTTHWSVQDNLGSEGTDSLYDVETIQFADGVFDVASGVFTPDLTIIDGDALDNTLNGTVGVDHINGFAGDDIINADDGDDTIIGGEGADTIDGGNGVDTVDYQTSTARIIADLSIGTVIDGFGAVDNISNVEDVIGSDYADSIIGDAQDNTFTGGLGNDDIEGAAGNDTLIGGDGRDTLIGGAGDDTLSGNADDDVLEYVLADNASATDVYDGDSGYDRIRFYFTTTEYTAAVQAELQSFKSFMDTNYDEAVSVGTSFTFTEFGFNVSDIEEMDVFVDGNIDTSYFTSLTATGATTNGTSDRDVIHGLNATGTGDEIKGFEGDDLIYGNNGADVVMGHQGDDTIYGGGYGDTLYGDSNNVDAPYGGNDTIYGENGSDTIRGGDGDDFLDGGDSADLIKGDYGNDVIYGGSSGDTLFGDRNADGSVGGNDLIYGGTHNDILNGGGGHDSLYGENDHDTLKGGEGMDYLEGGSGADKLYGNAGKDRLVGGDHNDKLYGGDDGDTLQGNAGFDKLYGENGNDILFAGAGWDYLSGGAGADTFMFFDMSDFTVGSGNQYNRILNDFSASEDVINIAAILDVNYDPMTDLLSDFVDVIDNGTDTYIRIDEDGTGSASVMNTVALIEGYTGHDHDETDMVNQGYLVV